MTHKKIMALFGIKWNPFQPEVPTEALYRRAELKAFIWRIENLLMDGGIASIVGDPGYGKSVALRLINDQLKGLRDVAVCRIDRPQSSLADFYRELGELFGVPLRISNRYGGFIALRKKWLQHIESTLFRPVLLIDEAQAMQSVTLSELRLLLSDDFDSKKILTVVLAGDQRFAERMADAELLPLKRRIRANLHLRPLSDEDMKLMLEHTLEACGNKQLLTPALIDTIVGHSAGNPSTMMQTGDELLARAIAMDKNQLDEKLFFDTYETPKSRTPNKSSNRGKDR